MAGETLVQAIRQVAQSEQRRSAPADFLYGTVVSSAPLTIQIDGAHSVLDASFFVLSALVRPFTTGLSHMHTCPSCGDKTDIQLENVTLWRGLVAGDRVRMLRAGGAQTFYILDREGSL